MLLNSYFVPSIEFRAEAYRAYRQPGEDDKKMMQSSLIDYSLTETNNPDRHDGSVFVVEFERSWCGPPRINWSLQCTVSILHSA